MSDLITVRGVVATDVRAVRTPDGLPIASFRLASTERKYNRAADTWSDGETNWFTISSFRHLAENVAFSIRKGERVMVTGRLKIRKWTREDGKSGTSAEIDADAVGHDLMWGVSQFRRFLQDRTVTDPQAGQSPAEDTENLPAFDPDTGEVRSAETGEREDAAGSEGARGTGKAAEGGPQDGGHPELDAPDHDESLALTPSGH